MKILLDTNVLISAFVFGGKAGQLLEKLFESDFELLVSDYVNKEFHDKLNEKMARQGFKSLRIVSNFAVFILFKFRYDKCASARSKRQPHVKRRYDA
jgi:predicted nucleic acid-binding protein